MKVHTDGATTSAQVAQSGREEERLRLGKTETEVILLVIKLT